MVLQDRAKRLKELQTLEEYRITKQRHRSAVVIQSVWRMCMYGRRGREVMRLEKQRRVSHKHRSHATRCVTPGVSRVATRESRHMVAALRCTARGARRQAIWSEAELAVHSGTSRCTPHILLHALFATIWYTMHRLICGFVCRIGSKRIGPDTGPEIPSKALELAASGGRSGQTNVVGYGLRARRTLCPPTASHTSAQSQSCGHHRCTWHTAAACTQITGT